MNFGNIKMQDSNDYPYSQQIHDKVLKDWKDIPFEEWEREGEFFYHKSVPYRLWGYSKTLCPEGLIDCLYGLHAQNLYTFLYENRIKKKENREKEQKIKQFLGLP